jgi:DNA-binding NarL/FixJ family response regulator
MTSLRILLLEDSETDAELIKHELQRSGVTSITRRVDSEQAFVQAVREFAPHVVLSDHYLSQFDASAALARLRELRPGTPLIVVTSSLDSDRPLTCFRQGAEDVILKSNLHRLAAAITDAVAVRQPLRHLTPRQMEVLKLVAEGYRTLAIAGRLSLSPKTVEAHRGEIMRRLSIHDLASLVRYAVRVGLVSGSP